MRPEALLEAAGLPIATPSRLSGGDMGEVWRCGDLVVKSHPRPPAGLFPAEARGLRAMAEVGVRVPHVHYVSEDGLVMDWLGSGPAAPEGLAEQVARLHGSARPTYGNPAPVFLGRFRFEAGESDDWRAFFAAHRLGPLLEATWSTLGAGARTVERALHEVEPAAEGPVLVHGDLWSGNVHHGVSGPALIDPGCYAGERGVDLAMMELFGGFGPEFWRAYEARLPIPEAVRAAIPWHQLCFLLVHVHFFGAGYVSGTVRAAETALRRS